MGRIVNIAWNVLLWAFLGYVGIEMLRDMLNPWIAVAVIVALVLSPFVIGPIVIHRTFWISLDLGLVPFDPDGPDSPEELRSVFDEIADQLGRLGFTAVRYYRTTQATSNSDGSVLLFRNGTTGETARVLTSVSVSSGPRISSCFVVFASEFSDGTEVVTSNRDSPRVFPPREPPFHGRAFPQVRDIEYLLGVHRARVENYAAGKIALDPAKDDPDGYLRRVDIEVAFAHHVACGYTYVDEAAGVQRNTWKGAILSTWKLLPPIKQIRLTWERFMAERQLRNFKAGRPVY